MVVTRGETLSYPVSNKISLFLVFLLWTERSFDIACYETYYPGNTRKKIPFLHGTYQAIGH